jgi:hypothetical protein
MDALNKMYVLDKLELDLLKIDCVKNVSDQIMKTKLAALKPLNKRLDLKSSKKQIE